MAEDNPDRTSLEDLASGEKPDFIQDSKAREKIADLKEKEENLYQEGAFSQGDAQKQQKLNEKIQDIAEKQGIDPSQIQTPEENPGPTTVGIETGVTQKQVETGEADVINARDENKETAINTQRQQDFIQESKADQFTIKPQNEERRTISREQALDRLETREQVAERQVNKTEKLLEQFETTRRNAQAPQEVSGDAPTPVEPTQRRIDTTKESRGRSGLESTLRDVRSGGLTLMQQGQNFGEYLANPQRSGTDLLQGISNRLNIDDRAEDTVIGGFRDIAPKGPLSAGAGTTGLALTSDVANIVSSQDISKQQRNDLLTTVSPLTSEDELQAQENLFEGAATFGTQAGGFFTAGGASLGLLAQEAVETGNSAKQARELGRGIQRFGTQFGSNLARKPSKVLGSEIGEEVGETAVGFAVGGGAGAAAGALPIPEITPRTPDSVQTAKNFVRGDLGFRATEKNVIEKPFESLGAQGQTVIGQVEQSALSKKAKQEFEMKDQDTRIQKAAQVNAEKDSVKVGQRTEERLSRTQFIKERLGLSNQEFADFLTNSRKGKLQFEVNTETEPSPNETQDMQLFSENIPEGKKFDATNAKLRFLEPGVQNTSGQRQELGIDEAQENTNRIKFEDTLDFAVKDAFDLKFDQQFRTEQQTEPENQFESRPESIFGRAEPDFRSNPDLSSESDRDELSLIEKESPSSAEQEFMFTPTLESSLFGQTKTVTEEELDQLNQQSFTGLEDRNLLVVDQENGKKADKKLQDSLGI